MFIHVAVLLSAASVSAAEDSITEVQDNLFSGSEIKSRRIGGNDDRRLKVLAAISTIEFSYYALVVDKDHVHADSGLAYKRSFYKFFHRMLCKRLTSAGANVSVVADRVGSTEFMQGFRDYISRHIGPDLFSSFDFCFADWHDAPLLQAADIVAGTLARIHDPEFISTRAAEFRRLLDGKCIAEHVWPPYWSRPEVFAEMHEPVANRWDADIARSCMNKAGAFISKNVGSQDDVRAMQAIIMDRLLQHRLLGEDRGQSIVSDKLIEILGQCGFDDLSKQAFTSKIIGGLRDEGFILAGTPSGYRLAMSHADIRDYLAHDDSVIGPMLFRLCKAQETIKMATQNELDILEPREYARLARLAQQIRRLQGV